ncbi:MAG: hypothetical protein ACPG7U_02045 [Holosporaceae bacterium]
MIVHEAGKITGEQLKKELLDCTTDPSNKYAQKATCVAVFKKTRRFLGIDPSKSLSKNARRQIGKMASKGKKKGKGAWKKTRGWFSSSYKKKNQAKAAETKAGQDQWKQKRDAGLKSHPQDARKTEQPLVGATPATGLPAESSAALLAKKGPPPPPPGTKPGALPRSTTGSESSIPPAPPPPPPPTAPPPPLPGNVGVQNKNAGANEKNKTLQPRPQSPEKSAHEEAMEKIASGDVSLRPTTTKIGKPSSQTQDEGIAKILGRRIAVADSSSEESGSETDSESDSGFSDVESTRKRQKRTKTRGTPRATDSVVTVKPKPPVPPKPQLKPKPVKTEGDDLPLPPPPMPENLAEMGIRG